MMFKKCVVVAGVGTTEVRCKLLRPAAKVDVCLEWNAVAIKANIMDHNGKDKAAELLSNTMGPPASARAFAMEHIAMFEAYNCVQKRYRSLYPEDHPIHDVDCDGASMSVAVAQAVRDVMCGIVNDGATGLFELEQDRIICDYVDSSLDTTLSRETHVEKKAKGIEVGHAIAEAVLHDRENDGYGPSNPYLKDVMYMPTGNPGEHMPDPDNPGQGVLGAAFGEMEPFGMSNTTLRQFREVGAPGMSVNEATGDLEFNASNAEYLEALRQVKEMGKFRGGNDGDFAPSDDETYVIANYWSIDASPGTGTPPAMLNDIVRKVAIERKNNEEQNCLLFGLANVAIGNAAISAWDSKFHDKLWRPIMAIREHPIPGQDRDEHWEPLGGSRTNAVDYGEMNGSPPFPGYTSGHATFGCAVFEMIANVYQSYEGFNYTSPEWNGHSVDQFNRTRACIVREFPTLVEAMAESDVSRVYNGVHFAFDGEKGCEAGMNIANHIFENIYLPHNQQSRQSMSTDSLPAAIQHYLAHTPKSGHAPETCDETPAYPLLV